MAVIGNDRWQVPQLAKSVSLPTGEYLLPIASMFANQTLVRTLIMRLQPHGIELATNNSTQNENFHAEVANLSEKNINTPVFDQRGDWINCTTPKKPHPIDYDPAMAEQSADYLAALDQFAARLQAKGVILRVTPATILVKSNAVQQWRKQYLAVSHALHTAVMLPINPSRQLLTDSTRFCDTSAHLLRSQITDNNRAAVEAVENLTDNQAITEPLKPVDANGAV